MASGHLGKGRGIERGGGVGIWKTSRRVEWVNWGLGTFRGGPGNLERGRKTSFKFVVFKHEENAGNRDLPQVGGGVRTGNFQLEEGRKARKIDPN